MASFYTTNTTTVGIVSILCQMMENCSPQQREKCLGIALHPLHQSTTTPTTSNIWRCKVHCKPISCNENKISLFSHVYPVIIAEIIFLLLGYPCLFSCSSKVTGFEGGFIPKTFQGLHFLFSGEQLVNRFLSSMPVKQIWRESTIKEPPIPFFKRAEEHLYVLYV